MNYLLIIAALLASTVANAAWFGTDIDKQSLRDQNLIVNGGCENGAQGITASGGTFTTDDSTPHFGSTVCLWDPSATAQTLTWDLKTLPTGLYGRPCYILAKQYGGDGNYQLQVWDGTTAIFSTTLAEQTTFRDVGFKFTCPSSGSLSARLLTTGDGAPIRLENVFLGDLPDKGVVVSPLVFTQGPQTIGAVGSSGQIMAGHLYGASSFDFTFADDAAYWYLQADALDDSGATSCTAGAAACDLTNNGSIGFTATDIFGNAASAPDLDGSTQSFSSTDAYFNPGDVDWSFVAWVQADDWTPASAGYIVSQGDNGANERSWQIVLGSDGTSRCRISADGTNTTESTAIAQADESRVDGSTWVFVACVHSATDDTLAYFIDGALASRVASGGINTAASSLFRLGARDSSGASDFFDGRIMLGGFFHQALSDEDIRKLYSYRKATDRSVPPESQEWLAHWERADGQIKNQPENGWLIDKRNTEVFWDLSGFDATDTAQLTMRQLGAGPIGIAATSFSTGMLSAAPSFPLAHGLPGRPASVWVVTEGQDTAGKWEIRNDLCEWDSTNIHNCDLGVLTIDGTHRVEIKASMYDLGTAADCANGATNGLLCGTIQSIDGEKTFTSQVTFSGGASGLFTTKALVRAYVSVSTTTVAGGGSAVTVPLNVVTYDLGSDFDTVNQRFVAPRTGYYRFTFKADWLGSANMDANEKLILSFWKNGGPGSGTNMGETTMTLQASPSPFDGRLTQLHDSIFLLTAGDTLEAGFAQDTGNTQSLLGSTDSETYLLIEEIDTKIAN